jgi:hypothetical protein
MLAIASDIEMRNTPSPLHHPLRGQRFGPHALHNTENVIPLEEALHMRLSALYSWKAPGVTGSTELTVRL